jgi:cation:H+ antiporter
MIEYALLIVGIALLIKGADWLIEGSINLAKILQLSPLVIGITIVAFGTSLPELAITIISTLEGSGGIALGNIVGSNISNLLLIFGISALFFPIRMSKSVLKIDLPLSIVAAVLLLSVALVSDNLNRPVGIIFVTIFIGFLYFTVFLTKKEKDKVRKQAAIKKKENIPKIGYAKIILLIAIGIFAPWVGGQITVDNALLIAKNIGINEFIISATIIAIGTSLPELITSLRALAKKRRRIAIGNIIGSNIFNIVWVLGFASLLKPILLPQKIIWDLIFLIISSLAFLMLVSIGKNRYLLNKRKGILLLGLYLLYIIIILVRG